jgi:hypothetical protein
MFNVNTLKLTVRDLAIASVLDELEDGDSHASLPEGHDDPKSFVDEVVMTDQDTLLELVANVSEIIGAVAAVWQQDVWLVFYHMGLRTDKKQADALYCLVMSVFGHGIGLDDDHSQMLARAERKLHGSFPSSPDVHRDQYCCLTNPISYLLEYCDAVC